MPNDTLAQKVRIKYPGVYDDLSDTELESKVLAKYPGVYDDIPLTEEKKPKARGFMSGNPAMMLQEGLANTGFLDELGATAGGLAGASLGPAAGILGAGLGSGALGALQRFMRGEVPTQRSVEQDVGMGGLGQAAGAGLGKALPVAGKAMYRAALRPSLNLRREFGDVAATGLKEGIPVTQAGADTAKQGVAASRDAAMQLIDQAAPTASTVPAREVVPSLRPVFEKGRRQAQVGENPNFAALQQRARQLLQTFGGPGQDVRAAQALKGEAQDLASTAYRAQDKGAVINELDALANKQTARALREAIERRIPGVGPQNARTQEMLGLLRALEDASLRETGGPSGLTTTLNRLLINPRILSSLGIAADRAGRSGAAPGAMQAILSLLDQETPQEPEP